MWPKVLRYVFIGLVVAAALLWLTTPDVAPLAKAAPVVTAFMRLRKEEAAGRGRAFHAQRAWRPLKEISPHLKHALIVSEDASFYDHGGVDLAETYGSFKRNLVKRRFARGGSTITQQLAKNLYLSPSKNPVRKVRELAITLELESHLSKDRIFELYLNSIEWGDGIFGAEAAARHYFGASARGLSEDQAATLAAIVPSPRRWGAMLDAKVVQQRKKIILRRMRARFGTTPTPATAPPAPAPVPTADLDDLDDAPTDEPIQE
jgi:monofunctional biosynthetic peptidoglycan transglycosylase